MGAQTRNEHGWEPKRRETGGGLKGIPNQRRDPGRSSLGAEEREVGTLPDGWGAKGSCPAKAGPQEELPSKKELAL